MAGRVENCDYYVELIVLLHTTAGVTQRAHAANSAEIYERKF